MRLARDRRLSSAWPALLHRRPGPSTLPATARSCSRAVDPSAARHCRRGARGRRVSCREPQRWALLAKPTSGRHACPTAPRRCPRVVPIGSYGADAVLPARRRRGCRAPCLVARRERLPVALVGRHRSIIERVLDLAALLTIGLVGAAVARRDRPDRLDRDRVHDRARRRPGGRRPFRGCRSRRRLPAPAPRPWHARWLALAVPRRPFGRGWRRGTSLLAYGLSALAWIGDVALVLDLRPARWASSLSLAAARRDRRRRRARDRAAGARAATSVRTSSGPSRSGTLAGVPSDSVACRSRVLAHAVRDRAARACSDRRRC